MKLNRKIILCSGGGLLTVLLLAFFFMIIVIRSPFPKVRGRKKVSGLEERVTVYRDDDGVPHIYGTSREDLFFAQGYVHAQDRFWQMEFWRRTGAGRLSEILGEDLVETDRFLRTMGFADVARREYENLPREDRQMLEAYTRGVNSYIGNRKPYRLGLEFTLLSLTGVSWEIEEWTPDNTLTWGKMMAYDLSMNMDTERDNLTILRWGGLPLKEAYNAPYRIDMPYIVTPEELVSFRDHWDINPDDYPVAPMKKLSFFRNGPSGLGSNNWAVSPELSASGHPIVANDMHLSVQMPSIWYEVGLHLTDKDGTDQEEFDLRGYSFPGIPGIITGQNNHIAWAVTNTGGDVQDYFTEMINPENPDQYMEEGEWRDMDIRLEKISVFGQDEAVIHRVRTTERGPVLSDLKGLSRLGGVDMRNKEGYAVSLGWTALEPSRLLEAVFAVDRADSIEEFREGLRLWDVPGQNFVFADDQGNIAYQTTGLYPVRSGHYGQVPALTEDNEVWEGTIPFDMMPGLYNPEKGYIVTANNPVVSPEYEYLIGLDFANGYRARQIAERLEDFGGDMTFEDMQNIHRDTYSLHAKEIVTLLKAITPESAFRIWQGYRKNLIDEGEKISLYKNDEDKDFLKEAVALWYDWDYSMDRESPGAAAYAYVWYRIMDNTLTDNNADWESLPGSVTSRESVINYLIDRPDHVVWDNLLTERREFRDDIMALSLVQGLFDARRELGEKTEKWEWGKAHTITFANATLGQSGISLIEKIFNRGPFPAQGASNTVNSSHWSMNHPFDVTVHSSQRSLLDPVEPGRSLFIHPTGQSGHPFHKHYDDFISVWSEVEYHPGRWSREEVEDNAGLRCLKLIPRG